MFKGFVLSESLKDPLVLNDYKKIYVTIERHTESKEHPFWHLFKIEVEDKDIEQVAERFSKEIKNKWYAHFWNDNIVYICFLNKIFKIRREEKWSSEEYEKVKRYAIEIGIEERYLDFWIED